MTIEMMPEAPVLEPTTPIKPSEALRLGRLIRPIHCMGVEFLGEDSACAIGAIHIGWGGTPDEYNSSPETYSRLRKLGIRSPISTIGQNIYDIEEYAGRDGDAAVLAYFESRGL